jgi:hypothetical protein
VAAEKEDPAIYFLLHDFNTDVPCHQRRQSIDEALLGQLFWTNWDK